VVFEMAWYMVMPLTLFRTQRIVACHVSDLASAQRRDSGGGLNVPRPSIGGENACFDQLGVSDRQAARKLELTKSISTAA
jgi:hypothetical protein